VYELGKVRPDHIKNLARKLLERFPNKFTKNFEANKKAVEKFTDVVSIKIRNRTAGYITHLLRIRNSMT
jgi:small subunit ribosomal protein S17e